jgi:hypothetical protein
MPCPCQKENGACVLACDKGFIMCCSECEDKNNCTCGRE